MPGVETPATAKAAGNWNVPNALTMLRVALVPVFVFLLVDGSLSTRWWALAVFLVASITDHLDGRLARSRGLITRFGTLADPIADKALTLGAFATFSLLGELSWWITIVIAVRELGITVLRAVLVRRAVIPASNGGKIKTTLQIVAIVAILLPHEALFAPSAAQAIEVVVAILVFAALGATVLTGLDYVVRGWRLVRA